MSIDRQMHTVAERIACQQVLTGDHSVFSVQRILLPDAVSGTISADGLLRLYLAYVERFTLGIIRSVATAGGIELRLAVFGVALIRFAAPLFETEPAAERATLRICGGLLVQPQACERGQLEFTVATTADGTSLTLQLADYCPLLLGSRKPSRSRKWLYRLTQAYIHRVVTVRFLRLVYRQLTGQKLATKTVRIVARSGENI